VPAQVSGRNRVWRKTIIDAIRNDPDWKGGDYQTQPPSLRTALELIWLVGSNPVLRYQEAPTLARADEVIDAYVAHGMTTDDANDTLYAIAASRDYDPGPELGKIAAPLLAINSADDLVNPPELGILEREITRVPHGRAVIIAYSDRTHGHGSHTYAALYKGYLEELLTSPER
jgi:homoserine O-acetyltransferase/O-succinyltransferase